MPPKEQTAWGPPVTLRASRPHVQARQSVGHQAGLHPEDTPYHTTQPQTRKPARVVHTDDQDADVYTEYRMPTVIRQYNRSPVPVQTRIQEEPYHVRVTPLRFFIIALGVIMLAFVLALLIISFLMPALNRWNDDRTYGYPRTTHARAIVGHGTKNQPDIVNLFVEAKHIAEL